MGVEEFLKSAAGRLPPIRRLLDQRATASALSASLIDRLTEMEDRHRSLGEAAAAETQARVAAEADQAQARQEAKQTSQALAIALRDADELSFDVDAMGAAVAGKGRYKSCAWIEEGVFITERDVNICCMQSIGNKTPRLFDVADEVPSFTEIQKEKLRFRMANQTNRAPCKGCYLLQEAEWETKKHITFMAIAGFLHCNLSCSYCVTYNFDPNDRGAEVFKVIKALHAQGVLIAGVSRLEWGGGESTFHRDFSKVAAFAAETGIQMTVYTNATAYVPALESGLRSGLFNIVCSVDAGFSGTYERIKGRNLLDKVWANLDRYAKLNPAAVKLKYIVMEANSSAAEIDEFMRRAKLSGSGVVIVSANAHNNTGADFQISDMVEEAAVYLHARAREAGLYVGLSEFYELELKEKLEERAINLSNDIVVPRVLQQNRPRPVEIAFVDARIFRQKVRMLIDKGEEFRVVLPQPVLADDAPGELISLLSDWRDAGSRMIEGPLSIFLGVAGDRPNAQSNSDDHEKLEAYDLDAVFNRDRLAALTFTLPQGERSFG